MDRPGVHHAHFGIPGELRKDPKAFEAAWKYAILTTMGAILALFGILLLYWGMHLAGGELFTWEGLAAEMPKIPPGMLKTGFILILIGLGSKAGMAPLHSWLPDAYSQAPVPICIFLSFVETATIPYVIFRLWPGFVGPVGATTGTWLVLFGLISAGVAAFLLIQAKEIKRLFAFSTIEHHGIILVAAGLGGAAAGYSAAYQIMTHMHHQILLFFCRGRCPAGGQEPADRIGARPCAQLSAGRGRRCCSGRWPFPGHRLLRCF